MKAPWKYVKVGAVCDVQNGYAFDSKLFNTESKGFPLIRIRDIKRGFTETFTTERCGDDYLVREGDFLIGMDGEFNIGQWKSETALLNQRVCKLMPSSKVLPKFIYYYIPKALKDIEEKTAYTTVKHLSSKQIKDISIPDLSLSEQQLIVEFLDHEFKKIDALKANAEKAIQAASDLFQATLKKELEPKEGWKKKRLDEMCEITAELIDPTLPEYINQIHIGGANIVAETGVLIDLKTSREENLISGKFPFDETMVLYSKIRPYLKKVCCPDFQGICSADIYPLKPSQDVDRTFLYYILLSQDFTDYAILGSARAGMPKVNRPYMFAYSCSIPEYEEQCKVANRLDVVREQTNTLQENYQKTITLCDDLKQSLLRKAFNGGF